MSAAARGSAAAVRLAVIGAIVLAVIAAFGAVGGWFSPGRLTRGALLAGLQGPNPKEPGFRRNHAKGMCASGWFDSTGSAREISRAALFQPGKVRVIARFGLRRLPAVPARQAWH